MLANQIQSYTKPVIHIGQVGFNPGRQKAVLTINSINEIKEENHTVISTDAENI